MEIRSRVIKTEPIPWQTLKFLQSEDFKACSLEEKSKLRHSLLTNEFSQPFYVWESPENGLYCLDGFHRFGVLKELQHEGIPVPDLLPGTFINCDDIKHAAKLVLQYSSVYAKITEWGMFDFLEAFDLNFEDEILAFDLPGFSMDTYLTRTSQDYSGNNAELDLNDFTGEITMKLVYQKAEYLEIKQRIATLMENTGHSTPEQLIKSLIYAV